MRILRYPQLKAEKGVDWTRVHLRRLEKAGRFPKHIDLGENSIGWVEAEVDDYLRQRVAERDQRKAAHQDDH